MSTPRPDAEPSLGQLVSTVAADTSALLRLEIELAKSELRSQAKQAAGGGAMIAAAVFLVVLVTILLSFAAVYGLAYVMPVYAAFLVVAGVYLLVAVLLGLVARSRFKHVKGPERAKAQVDATKQAFADQADLRAQAKASGLSVDELQARRVAEGTATAASSAASAATAAVPPTPAGRRPPPS
jgi:hypothetical protein